MAKLASLRLLLLPGLDGTASFFEPLIGKRPGDMDVRAVEYDTVEATGYDELVAHVVAALPDEDFCVLAWSFSGPLALMLAARRPPRLRGVILVASFAWRPIAFLPRWSSFFVRPALFAAYPLASMAQALVQGHSSQSLRALQREAFARPRPDRSLRACGCCYPWTCAGSSGPVPCPSCTCKRQTIA